MEKPEAFDVLVVGAGAAGIGVGAVLKELGLENFAILDTAPPANKLNIPRRDLWLSDIRPFKACASIPGRGT